MRIKKKVSLVLLLVLLTQVIFSDDLEDFRAAYALYKDGFYDVAARAFEEMAAHYPASSMYNDMLYYQVIALIKQNKIPQTLSPLWKLFDKKDYQYYSLGIKETNEELSIYKEASTSSKVIYKMKNESSNIKLYDLPVILVETSEDGNWVKIYTDHLLDENQERIVRDKSLSFDEG